MVCYKAGPLGVYIVDERLMDACTFWHRGIVSDSGYKNERYPEKHDTAYRYYQAHPDEE